jgi:DNA-binding NtrC family response regulator
LQRVKDGAFREDLFYRLNVYPIVVPPLRERRADIAHLVRHFMARVTSGKGSAPRINAISESALAMLEAYDWPGNIRQLENAVSRAVVLCDTGVLDMDEFPQIRAQVDGIDLSAHLPEPKTAAVGPDGRSGTGDAVLPEAANAAGAEPRQQAHFGLMRALDDRGNVRSLADVELEMIQLAISRYHGQMSEVARRLGIGRSTLYRKLKEYGIDPVDGRGAGTGSDPSTGLRLP